jgi:hypothetical protein
MNCSLHDDCLDMGSRLVSWISVGITTFALSTTWFFDAGKGSGVNTQRGERDTLWTLTFF